MCGLSDKPNEEAAVKNWLLAAVRRSSCVSHVPRVSKVSTCTLTIDSGQKVPSASWSCADEASARLRRISEEGHAAKSGPLMKL